MLGQIRSTDRHKAAQGHRSPKTAMPSEEEKESPAKTVDKILLTIKERVKNGKKNQK